MILNEYEYTKLYKKHKEKAILNSEEYVVRFTIKEDTGFWVRNEVSYRAPDKSSHQAVQDRWKIDYPFGDFISVTYQ